MKYHVGDVVSVRVSAIKSYGAFVVTKDHVSGLLHISELSHNYVKDVESVLAIDDELLVKIISIDESTKRIIFSKRAIETMQKKKRRTKKRERQTHHERIMETSSGFSGLKMMLEIWIEEYKDNYYD